MRLRHFLAGIRCGYPLCCVLRFAISDQCTQAIERGVCLHRDGVYVPCHWLHRQHLTAVEWAALLQARRLRSG